MTLRILLLGPVHDGGSLPPYLDVLTDALTAHGAAVTRHGSTEIPYDPGTGRFWPAERIRARAAELAADIDPSAHDVIALHAGNLEYDQLIPALLPTGSDVPVVHHVHTLAPTLLREHTPAPELQQLVDSAYAAAAGHVWFGAYARDRHPLPATNHGASVVAWLPTTIPAATRPAAGIALGKALATDLPIVSLYGYAAPWKDAQLLVDALAHVRTPVRAVLVGDFWDDPDQAGVDLRKYVNTPRPVGRAGELVVVPGYVDAPARLALVQASTAAVFPYRPHPSFQGSGAIADYLAHATPIVATDTANMAELVGPAGVTVRTSQPAAFALGIDDVVGGGAHHRWAAHRAHHFTPDAHAARCLRAYSAAAATRAPR